MHILFLTHYFPPEGNAPASRTYENCVRWVRAGHTVTVITGVPNVPDGNVYEGYRNRWVQTEMMDGIRVIRVWTFIAANKGTVLRILNFLSFMITSVLAGLTVKAPGLIIATSPQFFCGWGGVLLKWIRRKPFILEIRDIWPESIQAVGVRFPPWLIRVLEWLEKRMYRAADHIVTVGEGYRNALRARQVPDSRISIVMNGVDTELFHPDCPGQDVREEFSLQNRFVVSYVGTLGMASGLHVVLDAAEQLNGTGNPLNVTFLLVGDGAIRETLRQRADHAGLRNVLFAGRQPKARIPAILAASDACLVHLLKTPLFETVMPSKLFEAASMARPVINGVRGDAARWVRLAGAGINIEPEDAGELVAAVQSLAGDPRTAGDMGRSGLDYVRAHHLRDQLAEDYLGVIRRLLASLEFR